MSGSLQPTPVRTAVLADYIGRLLRGVMVAQQPIIWPARWCGDRLDYWLDSSVLLDPVGDSLATISVAVAPAASTADLRIERVEGCGTYAAFFVAGGVPGTTYAISMRITTAHGRVANIRGWMTVSEDIMQPCPASLLAPFEGPFGSPVTWSNGDIMFAPQPRLPDFTLMATGTTAMGAKPTPIGVILVNASTGANAGIILETPASEFCGQTVPFTNRSGVTVILYPRSGDTIETNQPGAGWPVQDGQTVNLRVAESGIILAT